jgi:hypothetical protein
MLKTSGEMILKILNLSSIELRFRHIGEKKAEISRNRSAVGVSIGERR